MCGVSGKPKRIFSLSFASDPIFQTFCLQYGSVHDGRLVRMNEEKTIHKFLNREKDEKIYDEWTDKFNCQTSPTELSVS